MKTYSTRLLVDVNSSVVPLRQEDRIVILQLDGFEPIAEYPFETRNQLFAARHPTERLKEYASIGRTGIIMIASLNKQTVVQGNLFLKGDD
jgi:hypothetical protein